jgi:hypothetical protein
MALPAHNNAKFLEQSLESIISQNFFDFKVLIFDDFSQDETSTIARTYSEKYSFIEYVRSSRRLGLAGAWKESARLVGQYWNPRYFCWFSDHDLVHSSWLKSLVEILDNYPGATLAHSKSEIIAPEGYIEQPGRGWIIADSDDPYVRLGEVLKSTDGVGEAIYGLFRYAVLEEIDFFPMELLPDRLVMLYAALRGKILFESQVLRSRRVQIQSEETGGIIERQFLTLFGDAGCPPVPGLSHAIYPFRNLERWTQNGVDFDVSAIAAYLHFMRCIDKKSLNLESDLQSESEELENHWAKLSKSLYRAHVKRREEDAERLEREKLKVVTLVEEKRSLDSHMQNIQINILEIMQKVAQVDSDNKQ